MGNIGSFSSHGFQLTLNFVPFFMTKFLCSLGTVNKKGHP